jgi:hypothetical protein
MRQQGKSVKQHDEATTKQKAKEKKKKKNESERR